MSGNLDDFLKGGAAPEPAPPPEAPERAPEAAKPEAEPAPEADQPKPDAGPDPEQPDGRHIPLQALESERKQRQDWKDRAARAEAERDTLMRQLEEARKAPPPQQQQPEQQPEQPQFVDPRVDPDGFLARMHQVTISNRLDVSEMMLRKEVGAETVDRLKTEFMAAANANRALWHELYKQPDPYAWAHQHMASLRFQREIGGDPDAYRAKLEAEIRAKLQAEMPQGPEPVPPAVLPRQAPSLARVNSAAPRNAVFSGPPSMDDILRGRKGA